MKTQVKYVATGLSAVFGVLLLAQCTSDRTDSQTAEKYEDFKEDVKQEYAEVKHEVKDVFDSEENDGADQYDPRWDDKPKSKSDEQSLKAEFADINQEFKEAFEALGTSIEHEFDHTEQKMAVNRLERISNRLDRKMDKLEDRLDREDKLFEAADELATMKAVQADLKMQIAAVKSATHNNWDDVRKDTRKTCKEANDEIAEQVDEIQDILAEAK